MVPLPSSQVSGSTPQKQVRSEVKIKIIKGWRFWLFYKLLRKHKPSIIREIKE